MYGEIENNLTDRFTHYNLSNAVYDWLGDAAPKYYYFNAYEAGDNSWFCENFVQHLAKKLKKPVIAYYSDKDVCRGDQLHFDQYLDCQQSMKMFANESNQNPNDFIIKTVREWLDEIKVLATQTGGKKLLKYIELEKNRLAVTNRLFGGKY
jgi:hypothetical protein